MKNANRCQTTPALPASAAYRRSDPAGIGTRVVGEGTELVAAASQLLSTAKAEETRKTQVVDEVVTLMEKIAAVSIENRSVSGEVESNMQELIGDIVRVRHTSHHVEAITSLLQQLVGQFQLTEARKR
jgi:methyl-accepting chemotaxis protein